MLHNLQSLYIHEFVWDDCWLRQLDSLPRLQNLLLHGCQWEDDGEEDMESLAMVVPPLHHVTLLDLSPGSYATVRLTPPEFPSLLELHLDSYLGNTNVVDTPTWDSDSSIDSGGGGGGSWGRGGGSGASNLGGTSGVSAVTHLSLLGDMASSVDFAALPALCNAHLWCS